MPGRRPQAALALVLAALLTCACQPTLPPTEPDRPAPSTRRTRPEQPPTRPSYSADDAISRLRTRLRARGFAPEVTAGPMLALWSDDPPPNRVAAESGVPAAVRHAVTNPTWLVLTDAGAWWVWEHDDLGPVAYATSDPLLTHPWSPRGSPPPRARRWVVLVGAFAVEEPAAVDAYVASMRDLVPVARDAGVPIGSESTLATLREAFGL